MPECPLFSGENFGEEKIQVMARGNAQQNSYKVFNNIDPLETTAGQGLDDFGKGTVGKKENEDGHEGEPVPRQFEE